MTMLTMLTSITDSLFTREGVTTEGGGGEEDDARDDMAKSNDEPEVEKVAEVSQKCEKEEGAGGTEQVKDGEEGEDVDYASLSLAELSTLCKSSQGLSKPPLPLITDHPIQTCSFSSLKDDLSNLSTSLLASMSPSERPSTSKSPFTTTTAASITSSRSSATQETPPSSTSTHMGSSKLAPSHPRVSPSHCSLRIFDTVLIPIFPLSYLHKYLPHDVVFGEDASDLECIPEDGKIQVEADINDFDNFREFYMLWERGEEFRAQSSGYIPWGRPTEREQEMRSRKGKEGEGWKGLCAVNWEERESRVVRKKKKRRVMMVESDEESDGRNDISRSEIKRMKKGKTRKGSEDEENEEWALNGVKDTCQIFTKKKRRRLKDRDDFSEFEISKGRSQKRKKHGDERKGPTGKRRKINSDQVGSLPNNAPCQIVFTLPNGNSFTTSINYPTKTCHACVNKTNIPKLICPRCNFRFCLRCIINRHITYFDQTMISSASENVENNRADLIWQDWKNEGCMKCKGDCTCARCRDKRGEVRESTRLNKRNASTSTNPNRATAVVKVKGVKKKKKGENEEKNENKVPRFIRVDRPGAILPSRNPIPPELRHIDPYANINDSSMNDGDDEGTTTTDMSDSSFGDEDAIGEPDFKFDLPSFTQFMENGVMSEMDRDMGIGVGHLGMGMGLESAGVGFLQDEQLFDLVKKSMGEVVEREGKDIDVNEWVGGGINPLELDGSSHRFLY